MTRGEMALFIMRGASNWLLPAAEPVIVSVTPNQLACCNPLTVVAIGANTHFIQGLTVLVVPSGIIASDLTVLSPTAFSVVLQGSLLQPEPFYVQTGTEEEVLPNGLIPSEY